ncbi:MGH1-like glycoside hydrolase domain-containing protein [Hymenobacter perfusus]|uniref:Glucosidase n=1 Tax=Hymenobacter perfusus TaxID=1236770 RepID=A0A428K9Z4_9BACT|nr:glucosidase [Hymenobacter perfusus]RSK43257.1 glucosidase [Hymenobacter perfusus]
MTEEQQRQQEARDGQAAWHRFGPYVSERQWGTVREDYSADEQPWTYTTHDMARSYAYRWGEDAIGGVCDEKQFLCLAPAFWNGQDAILKERLFGLSGPEGNHGEDVKEHYYYLDNTPTHSYMRMLYKYPQHAFPYDWLVQENARRGRQKPEFELADTCVFKEDRYFDIFLEYAKAGPEDLLLQITVYNRGAQEAPLHVLPQLWFRNTWAWGYAAYRPQLDSTEAGAINVDHSSLPPLALYYDQPDKQPANLLFCDNETNAQRLHGAPNAAEFSKDGINDYLLHGHQEAVNPAHQGTKVAVHYQLSIPAGESRTVRVRLAAPGLQDPFAEFAAILGQRKAEADSYYLALQTGIDNPDARNVQRQALAGMLWSKQFYYYDVAEWLKGDPAFPEPPANRRQGRNHTWPHLNNADIISMPDKWEYPWYAAWDLAFHCIPLAMVDVDFAKNQLRLLCQDWYMHPNGQLPAYEWKLEDVNPPVHAWATWRVYKMDQKQRGQRDTPFLESMFHRLLLNFTWWVNRKDRHNHNVFEGGFLGLDNIGVFDRSAPLPTGGYMEQADGTAWMAMFALNMMRIALELARTNPVYQDLASKFFEHFLYIAHAMGNMGEQQIDMWDDEDGFYYDVLNTPENGRFPLRLRSMVGLIPLFAVEVLDTDALQEMPRFVSRLNWFLDHRPELAALVSRWQEPGKGQRHLLSLLRGHRMKLLLRRMLDEAEFLSEHGVRALSRYHLEHPFVFQREGGLNAVVSYEPAESSTSLFGGNSNWRGPVWMPMNFLLIESLQRFYHYYGPEFKVEYPTGTGRYCTLQEIALALTERLTSLFLRNAEGQRPCFGQDKQQQNDPHFRDYLLFHEYFHGDTGAGLGASHQTGWTGLIAKLLHPRPLEE